MTAPSDRGTEGSSRETGATLSSRHAHIAALLSTTQRLLALTGVMGVLLATGLFFLADRQTGTSLRLNDTPPSLARAPAAGLRAPSLDRYEVDLLTEPDGLSNNTVVSIAQDHQGFMWFGSWYGLNRYDGHSFKTYYSDPSDPSSLPHSWVEALHVDADGTLWVGTHGGGLARYDAEADAFRRFQHDPDDDRTISQDTVTAVLRDSRGILWVGTHRGLDRYDAEGRRFVHYRTAPDDPTSLSNDQVRALYEDREGTLWVGTGSTTVSETPAGEGGLNRYDPDTDAFVRYLHDPADPRSLYDNKVRALFEDSRGTFWVGTAGNVLHRMDRAAGTFTRLAYDPARPDRLVPADGVGGHDGCVGACVTVTFVREDPYGRLWVGLHSVGLLVIDPQTDRVYRFDAADDGHQPLGSDIPWSAHFSRDGTAWVGAMLGGLQRMVPAPDEAGSLFRALGVAGAGSAADGADQDPNTYFGKMVNDLHVARDGAVWAAMVRGLERYDPETETSTSFLARRGDPARLDGPVSQVLEASDGTVWALSFRGTLHRLIGDGVVRYGLGLPEKADETFEQLYRDPAAVALYETRDGSLWVGTLGDGVRRFDPATSVLEAYREGRDEGGWPGGDVVDFVEDRDGTLWAATTRSVVHVERRGDGVVFRETPAPSPSTVDPLTVTDLFQDGQGRLLVGTTEGVFKFDGATGAYETVYGSDGPLGRGAAVASLVEDAAGYLWVSTYEGPSINPVQGSLLRHDMATGTTLAFGVDDGLPSIGFVNRSAARAPDGTLYVGGVPGVVAVDPAAVEREPVPQAVLTGLVVRGEPVPVGSEGPLDRAAPYVREVRLDYDQNDFEIAYVAPYYRAPDEVQYEHRLEPYDRGWVANTTGHSARYSRVPPGHYVFRVRASNRYGVWPDGATSVAVVVAPPWWRTWWAYGLYALAGLAGLLAVDRTRRRQVVERERARAEREREAARLREQELAAEAARSRADYLQAENRRQTLELERKREVERAYAKLEASHAELRQTQAQLVQAEKLASLGRLSAGIAHEIKNPLNFVLNFSSLNEELAEDLRAAIVAQDTEEATELVEEIRRNARRVREHGNRADAIVGGMMAHARSAPGERRTLDFNALVEEHVSLALEGQEGDGEDVVLDKDYGRTVGVVHVVPQEVGRVVLNLVDNALTAVQDRARDAADPAYVPTVRVSTCRVGDRVEVRITDNGKGVDAAVRPRVFEPFFTTKPTGEGTGLGLSISYDIVVNGYGGALTLEDAEGEGVTFSMSLPLPDASGEAIGPSASLPAAQVPASG